MDNPHTDENILDSTMLAGESRVGFQISNRRYIWFVVSILFILSYYVVVGLRWSGNDNFIWNDGFDWVDAVYFLTHCMVSLVFISYFSYYNLRFLKWLTVLLLAVGMINEPLRFIPGAPEILVMVLSYTSTIMFLLWMVAVLRLKAPLYTGGYLLKWYSITWLCAFALSVMFTVVTVSHYVSLPFKPHLLPLAMPYFVLLRFAGVLRSRADVQEAGSMPS
jgi:hypothetical protein